MAKQMKYTDEFRQEAVDMFQNGNDSAAGVARKLGVHEHTIYRWIQLYGKDRALSSQTASTTSALKEKLCQAQKFDLNPLDALGYIQTIKKQVSELEKLLLKLMEHDESET